MAAEPVPPSMTLRTTGGSAVDRRTTKNGGLTVSPAELYYHITGHWPGDGTESIEGSVPGPSRQATSGSSGDFTSEASGAVEGDRDEDGARSKKRRKTSRRTKTSEIWYDTAELAFCTAVACIPPNGRTKIKFYGRPLGRNELIAAICTLATKRMYNRKQISSHSQVLKDKVPHPFKEIFTFEDKSRTGEDHGESATANVIDNYDFPPAIYEIIKEPLGKDLANAEKPEFLLQLEAGEVPQIAPPPINEPTTRSIYWDGDRDGGARAPSGFYDHYGRAGPPPRREANLPPPSSVLDSSGYYSYSQPLRHQPDPLSPYGSTSLPPPHSLASLPLEPQSPVTSPGSGDLGRRYGTQSQSRTLYDTKPSISGDGITLPQLQDPWSVSTRSGIPSLAPLQTLTGATGPSSPGYGSWSGSAGSLGYVPSSTWNGDSREPVRPRVFTPESLHLLWQTPSGPITLASSDVACPPGTINLSEIYQSSARYGFLYNFPPPRVPVFHLEVPILVPAERRTLLQQVPELILTSSMRSLADSAGWALTTDSAYTNPDGNPTSYKRSISPLRLLSSNSDTFSSTAYLMDLAALYKNFAQNEESRTQSSAPYDALINFAIPFTSLVQRVVRDANPTSRRGPIGSDLNEAACVFIYSFYVPTEPNARPICQQVVFDVNSMGRVTLDAAADTFVANLIAGEEADPSRFSWMFPQP